MLYEAHKLLNQIRASEETEAINMSPRTLHQIFKQYISQTSVPFVGEPLNGLQIMGMLETRALDFETVFMLSVNEGVLPKAKSMTSFIPHGIRYDSGLTTYVHNEQIFAYHFYHVLQRSKKIWLIYNTQADDFGGGERSRFISQLLYELPAYNPNIKIREHFVALPPLKENHQPVVIKKDDAIMLKLDAIALKGVSPSALNMFRKCKLQYYFSYIAGIREANELNEILDSREFGTQIHEVLSSLFKEVVDTELSADILRSFLDTYKNILSVSYQADAPNNIDRMSGKNLLIYNVIDYYLHDFLEKQLEMVEELSELHQSLRVMMVEQRLETFTNIDVNPEPKTVKVLGTIDRVDRSGSATTIIDYKTGDIKQQNFDLEKLLADDSKKKNDYAFQLMCYAWLLSKTETSAQGGELNCGVWGFKNLGEGLKRIYYAAEPNSKTKLYSITPEIINQFEGFLNDMLCQLFSADVDFDQTENKDNCLNCIFATFCL